MNAIGMALRQTAAITPIDAGDMDSLHVLPLHILPLQNEKLAKHKLIKNNQLEGVVEVYASRESGSGQVSIAAMPDIFGIKNPAVDPDYRMLVRLANLPSYDVYSLRRSIRDLGINIKDNSALHLSEDMNRVLAGYMSRFTKPLLSSIYGGAGQQVERFEDLIGLFRDPDVKKALAKLRTMAEKLGTSLDQIPRFIEDYGDIFLSLSYYQHCLARIAPIINEFHLSINELKSGYAMKSKPQIVAEANRIQKMLNALLAYVQRVFEDFEARSQDMWTNLSAQKFKHVQDVIENAHTTVGGVLCGLTVKMTAWEKRFPSARSGSPGLREDFLLAEIRPGLSELVDLVRENSSVVGYT
jgi:hypothetical protein